MKISDRTPGHPVSIRLLLVSLLAAAAGCGSEAPPPGEGPSPAAVIGTAWQVEDIDGGGIVDSSMITITFMEDGRIGGSTGCNRYFGPVNLDGNNLSMGSIGSTRRGCAPALMQQEQRFLAALEDAAAYSFDEVGRLRIHDASDSVRLTAVEIDEDPTAGS